jgi:hypothetical protein
MPCVFSIIRFRAGTPERRREAAGLVAELAAAADHEVVELGADGVV